MAGIRKKFAQFFGIGEASKLRVAGPELPPDEAAIIHTVHAINPKDIAARLRAETAPLMKLHSTWTLTERTRELFAGAEKIATDHDIREQLTETVEKTGSQKLVARSLGVSKSYIGDLLLGRRGISPEMAERLGWKKVEVFVRKK